MSVVIDVLAVLGGVLICGGLCWLVWTNGPQKEDR